MPHAYTGGLKVTDWVTLRKSRLLPMKGEVVVDIGSLVKPDDVVARTFLPGEVHPLNIANILNLPPADVPAHMLVKEHDNITKGQVIAETKGFFGLFKSRAFATIDGSIESISAVTGQVLQRGQRIPIDVLAYVAGRVVDVIQDEGVVVEVSGAFVQGIFGIGGETFGTVRVVCSSPSDVLIHDHISEDHKGAIIIGGSLVTREALERAVAVGVKGIIVGGLDDKDLRTFLGYDLGVAITGSEALGITLIVTEGFGRISMAKRTFALLSSYEGMDASVSGATQIRAGVIRPEIIIPIEQVPLEKKKSAKATEQGLLVGTSVRIIRQPFFGRLGNVVDLRSDLVVLESGSKARVVEVEFTDGERVLIPRANVELVEG